MSDVSNLSDTIIPKSDQLNSEQLLSGPITVRINEVKRGNDDQPVVVGYDGDNGRPYKPCKSMRKVLIFAWGDDGREWVGRSMTLFNDPSVMFGGVKVGGIRISHLSHIERDIALSLTTKKGKKEAFVIKKLADQGRPLDRDIELATIELRAAACHGTKRLQEEWKKISAPIRESIGNGSGCPAELKAIAAAADQKKQAEE